jgi:hypothetical protein
VIRRGGIPMIKMCIENGHGEFIPTHSDREDEQAQEVECEWVDGDGWTPISEQDDDMDDWTQRKESM